MLFEVSYLDLVSYANPSNFGKIASHRKRILSSTRAKRFFSNFHERKPYFEKVTTVRLISH